MEVFFISDLFVDTYIEATNNCNVSKYVSFLDKHTLPADVLCIAGNIGSDVFSVVSLLSAASTMFRKVIYVNGALESTVTSNDTFSALEKRDRILKFTKTLARTNVVNMLDGDKSNRGSLTIDGIVFRGTTGFSDQPNGSIDNVYSNRQWWTESYDKLSTVELGYLNGLNTDGLADVIVSHFAPHLHLGVNEQKFNLNKEYNTFNGRRILNSLKDGGIYHYGRVLSRTKKEVKNKNGRILLLNNCLGSKIRKGKSNILDNGLTKRDFLISI